MDSAARMLITCIGNQWSTAHAKIKSHKPKQMKVSGVYSFNESNSNIQARVWESQEPAYQHIFHGCNGLTIWRDCLLFIFNDNGDAGQTNCAIRAHNQIRQIPRNPTLLKEEETASDASGRYKEFKLRTRQELRRINAVHARKYNNSSTPTKRLLLFIYAALRHELIIRHKDYQVLYF
jgi:hypothetical protein